jgi:hypothetical protein
MNKFFLPLLFLLLAFCSIGCGSDQAAIDTIGTQVAQAMEATQDAKATQVERTQLAAEMTANVTPTPTITHTPTVTLTETPSPTLEPSLTPSLTETEIPTETPIGYIPEDAVWFYVTSIGTGGNIGCGDTLIKLWTGYVRSGNTVTDLTNALNTVFSVGQYAGGFYNATYPSNLRVKEISMSSDGTATVYFDGSYVPPKDSCDASRFRSQVWGTALQFPEVTRFIPWIGTKLLGDRLSAFSDSGK